MPKLNESVKKISTRSGLYLGLLMALLTLTVYYINWDIFISGWFQPLKLMLVLVFAVMAAFLARRENPRKFSFRDAFSAYIISVVIGTAIMMVVEYVLLYLINPGAGHYITKMSIEKYLGDAQKAGQDMEKIRQSVSGIKNSNSFSFGAQFQGYVMNLILYAIPGALVALIFKTKKPIIV